MSKLVKMASPNYITVAGHRICPEKVNTLIIRKSRVWLKNPYVVEVHQQTRAIPVFGFGPVYSNGVLPTSIIAVKTLDDAQQIVGKVTEAEGFKGRITAKL